MKRRSFIGGLVGLVCLPFGLRWRDEAKPDDVLVRRKAMLDKAMARYGDIGEEVDYGSRKALFCTLDDRSYVLFSYSLTRVVEDICRLGWSDRERYLNAVVYLQSVFDDPSICKTDLVVVKSNNSRLMEAEYHWCKSTFPSRYWIRAGLLSLHGENREYRWDHLHWGFRRHEETKK